MDEEILRRRERTFDNIAELYGQARRECPAAAEEVPDARDEIEHSGYCEDVRLARDMWIQEFTADRYVEMMSTASDHQIMDLVKR